MEVREGVSVKVKDHLNNLPSKILSRELGMRRAGVVGIVAAASMPGFDSHAISIDHREAFGERTGEWGIYFAGEYEIIPDLPPAD